MLEVSCARGADGRLLVAALDFVGRVHLAHEVDGRRLSELRDQGRSGRHVALARGPDNLLSLFVAAEDATWQHVERRPGTWVGWRRAGPAGEEAAAARQHDGRLLLFVRTGTGEVWWTRQGVPRRAPSSPTMIEGYDDWSDPKAVPFIDTRALTIVAGAQASHVTLLAINGHGTLSSYDQTVANHDTFA